jgi:hypothetical protein
VPPTKTTTPAAPPAPPSAGGGVPGSGAPDTGGEGDTSPVNGLVGSALLAAAAGVLGAEALRRRRETDKA